MATELEDLVTTEGNISMLDRVGGKITVTVTDSVGAAVNLASTSIYFEIGTVSINLIGPTNARYFVVTPANIDTIVAQKANRYVVVDKATDPDKIYWEGFFFVRSVS